MIRSTSSSEPLVQPSSTGLANYDSRISKRKLSTSSNSGFCMDPDVIEIPPPFRRSVKSKQKQVVIHEVIDVDEDEDLTDIMIIDERNGVRDKGKAVKSSSGAYSTIQCEDLEDKSLGSVKKVEPSKNYTQGSQNIFNLDHHDDYVMSYMIQAHFDSVDIPAGVEAAVPWFSDFLNSKKRTSHGNISSFPDPAAGAHVTHQELAGIKNKRDVNSEDIISKLQLFKKFDTVEVFSDHYYASEGASTKEPPNCWSKKIQEDWKILEKDLPDTIFVRVSEKRMDLLRAVIIGAEGTPYHDGLFFFDVFFPASYPKVPPHVYYHSGGLRLNPNLYDCGKVCLSLLNTWPGNDNENWMPSMSTMLQVLVSIQALILNQKPYFNEPGREQLSHIPQGESLSRQYNEDTFILSLRTMIYSMKRPPKHFEDFVVAHFFKRAHDILVACKAYMDGAQVGCLAKGGVQDVDEGDKSCSQNFKDSVAECVNLLVKEFKVLGADCEKFLTAPKC